MANTFGIQRLLVARGPIGEIVPNVVVYPILAGQTFFNGAVLINDGSGNCKEAANDPTTLIIGVALHDARATYTPLTGTSVQEPDPTKLFGFGQGGTKLQPTDVTQMHIAHGDAAQIYEGTGVLATWAASMVGGQFGLEKDATTGFWVVDLSDAATHTVQVVGLVNKPQTLSGGQGGAMPAVGDTNVRILFTFVQATVTG